MKKLYYGAAYYPELWDDEVVNQDILLMQEAGINLVRIAEFAWSSLEPHRDDFRENCFVDTITKLYANGIEVVVCTPTATPPVWISHNHRERMIVDENNITMCHGGRQQVCTNNEFLRERAAIIIERMAKVYGALPGVIGWQIDNELKGNVSECYCENCKCLWHSWLEKKYKNIESLNTAWGTHIWSQYYETFNQVPQPLKTPLGHNPSLTTAYRLFSRELTSEYVVMQSEIIRKHSKFPITHNANFNHFIDNEKTYESLDFASFDHYCTSPDYHQMFTHMDAYKTLKPNKPFWVMETSPSFSGNVYGYQTIHNNGFLKAESAAAYAFGAEGFCYWLWRQHRSGIERTHGSILNSWGMPTAGFNNVVEAGKFKDQLEKVLLKTMPVQGEIAISYSDRSRAFFMTEPLEGYSYNYVEIMMKWHQMVLDSGIHRDIIFENSSFEGYKLLMTPFMQNISEDYIARASKFVENGGIWIVGPVSGIRTDEHTIHTDHALGSLEEIAGVKTIYHYPMTGSGVIGNAFGLKAPLALWSSVFECRGAKPMGMTEGGVTPDMPFITEFKKGRGIVVLLGAMPMEEQGRNMLTQLLIHYAEEAGINITNHTTSGTIAVPRKGEKLCQWVIINMDGRGGQATHSVTCRDAWTGETIKAGNTIKLKPYDCRVIEYYEEG